MKKKTPKNDWAAQIADLAQVVDRVAFQPTPTGYQHTLAPTAPGAPLAVIKAKARAKDGATPVLVRMPAETLERVKALTVGSHTVAIGALADWALDYLESTQQAIEVNEKQRSG